MKQHLLVFLGLAFCHLLSAQSNNPWIFKSESQLTTKQHLQRQIIPDAYRTAQLDLGSLKTLLQQAPMWQTNEVEKKAVSLTLPMPDGSFQEFSIQEASVMHADLQKKYPLIRSYAGTGVDDPTAYLRFDLTPAGFHAMILTGMSSDVFIDPYSQGDLENYVVYYKKDYAEKGDWKCLVEENSKEPVATGTAKAGDCKLRTYSLALACTGEYAAYHGGTSTLALAAMNTTMTRVNGIFEKDLSVTLQLVSNNNLLVYTNSSTDPYTNNNGSTMLTENINNCNAVIGSANYDIGHVFSTGGGGIAYVKAVCSSSVKGGGVTGRSAPIGDPFNVDYVAHEMGHQLGANHVQNNACNRNDATAVEPGSGSTIMGYAGVCTPNIQSNSDAYFNAISLGEIAAHVTSTAGNGCATSSTINNAPTANAGADYTIPKSTYFVLTGTGTDPDAGQTLTYCWEQMDNAAATMPPVATSTGGPAFRSLAPSSSLSRYFPNLTAIVNNTAQTWEVLPSVSRTMNFRFTVRDNKVGGGCTKEDNMVVTVSSTSGPFVVTAPNTAVSWAGGSTQTITWSVANTTASPVSAANVDILLSTDGGFTYPTTILSGTPNDGTQSVTIPNNPSTQARIMVRGSGKIFFDISNVNFTITSGSNPPLAVTLSSTNVNCNGGSTGSATANPTGGSGTYTYAWSNSATTQTISNLAAATYTVTVTSSGTTSTASVTITQPTVLAVAMSSVNPTSGNNGSATATPSGGTGIYTVNWSNGGNTMTISNLAAGTYTATVTDANGCTKTGSVTLTAGGSAVKFEYGLLTNVTNTWQTVTLQNTYTNMVVVANVVMASSTAATWTTRIQNATGNSFQVKLQVAGNATGAAGPANVYYIVAEAGTYTTAANGVKFEAKKFT
ncbi:MAG: reprolysin-like metallopeptidase, partial [Bacteroidota bacterium]